MKWLLALVLVFGCLLWFLHDLAPSEEELAGVYVGTYKDFLDQVELTKDHKFNQTLRSPNRETIKSSGTWSLTNKALELDGYIFFIDEQVPGSSDKPIRTSVTFTAHRGMLIRDWGTGFYKLTHQEKLEEQASTGQPAPRPLGEPEGGDKPQPEAEGRGSA